MQQITYFKRLLKELGIYGLWLKNRKNFASKNPSESQNLLSNEPMRFSWYIGKSFYWLDTDNEFLWVELYFADQISTPLEILKNQDILNKLKKLINELI